MKTKLPKKLAVLKDEPPKEPSRCTGHCCRRFSIPEPPEEIWKRYEAWQKGSSDRRLTVDIHIIAPMLIYLGQSSYDCDGLTMREPKHFYTCKHFNTESGDCTIYKYRPQMCSEYPYGSTCRYLDCTADRDAFKTRNLLKTLERERDGYCYPELHGSREKLDGTTEPSMLDEDFMVSPGPTSISVAPGPGPYEAEEKYEAVGEAVGEISLKDLGEMIAREID
jgi:Fe-S-cluster containining protein